MRPWSMLLQSKRNIVNGWNSYEKRIANHDVDRVHANNLHSPNLSLPSHNYEPITNTIHSVNLSAILLYHLFILSENMLIKSFKKVWDINILLKQNWKKKLITAYLIYWLFQRSVFTVVAEGQQNRCPKKLKSIWPKSWVTSDE